MKEMKKIILSASIAFCMVAVSTESFAQTKEIYSLEKTIPLSGDGSFDYSYTDETDRRLYVSHGNAVHVIDLNTDSAIGIIENLQGVHGVVIVHNVGKGFITDGKNNAVSVFDIKTLKVIKTISLKGKKADAIMYDSYSNKVLAFNNGGTNASVIDIEKLEEIKLIELGGAPEFGVSDGKGKIYNNVEDKNLMVVIDANTLAVVDSMSVKPNGTPTALGYDAKNKRAFVGCREGQSLVVLDVSKKEIVATLPICKGVDAIVFDEATKLIFCSGDGTTTIIKQNGANKYKVVQTITTKPRAKTLAVDKQTHKIYVNSADYEGNTKKVIIGSFALMVYKKN
jgi:DNA-binding beta-propeller fold protein YncE